MRWKKTIAALSLCALLTGQAGALEVRIKFL